MPITTDDKHKIESLITENGCKDFKWIDPQEIIVAQWVRMKCMFGCGEYGRGASCPPNTPSVSDCERFFGEYGDAVILHFQGKMDRPDDRHAWSSKINVKLAKLEREVFLSGQEKVFCLFMDSCNICKECTGSRETCKEPRLARPGPEAMAVDVYSTVRQFGFPINVKTDYQQTMDRYAFLMVR